MSAPSSPLVGRPPAFRAPRTLPVDPLLTEDVDQVVDAAPPPASAEQEQESRPRRPLAGLRERLSQKPAPDGTRTATSSVGKPSAEDTAGLIIGLLGIAVSIAAWSVRKRGKLRRPTDRQERSIAAPLARIGLRFVDAGLLDATLVDVISAGAAASAYLTDGPLIIAGGNVDPGVPTDVNADPEGEI